jgi:hypothetical protein
MTTETNIIPSNEEILESIKVLISLYQAFAKVGWAKLAQSLYNSCVVLNKMYENAQYQEVCEWIEQYLNQIRLSLFTEESQAQVGKIISVSNHNKYMFDAPIYEYICDSMDKVEELLKIDLSGIVDDRPESFKVSHPVLKPEDEGKIVSEVEND